LLIFVNYLFAICWFYVLFGIFNALLAKNKTNPPFRLCKQFYNYALVFARNQEIKCMRALKVSTKNLKKKKK